MNEETKNQDETSVVQGAPHPLEQLTSLVLDAADAANDSAQSTQETIAKLAEIVETNEQTTRAVRNAPAIFGAVMLGIGVVMAVVVAIVFSRITEKAATLDASIAAQNEALERNEAALKELKVLESSLAKFQNIAEETTQRAVVTLREQVKTDRIALQQLEVRRLNEMLASLRGGIASAARPATGHADESGVKLAALEKSIASVDARLRAGRLEAMEDGIKRVDTRLAALEKAAASTTGGGRAPSAVSDAQAKEMKAVIEELAGLKVEVGTLRGLLERRTSEAPSAGPTFRKSGSGG